MIIPDKIDTNGFPYVHGIPEYIYDTLIMPTTETECNEMLGELKNTKTDIYLQLSINDLNKHRDETWEQSALQKIRIIRFQQRILCAVRQSFVSKRKTKESEELVTLKLLNDKITSLTTKTEKHSKKIHDLEKRTYYLERFILKMIYHIENNTLNELTSDYEVEIKEVKRILSLSPNFGKLITDLRKT